MEGELQREHHDYYLRRAAQARLFADRARDASARRAHLAMAARYSALINVVVDDKERGAVN